MENRIVLAMVIITGVAGLMVYAGHFSTLVPGSENPAPVVQTPGPGPQSSSGSAGLPGTGAGAVQTFTLKSIDGQYDPAVISVKQGTTVRIEGDIATLTGCMTTVDIDGYGISKHITAGDNVITFTADRVGTFPIHCTMGMGNGKLVVG